MERGKRRKEEKKTGRKRKTKERWKNKKEKKRVTLENGSQIKIIKLFLSMNRSKKNILCAPLLASNLTEKLNKKCQQFFPLRIY